MAPLVRLLCGRKQTMVKTSSLPILTLVTCVYPESKSFRGKGYGPIPTKWKGDCGNDTFCNNKLIGAKYYNNGYQAKYGKMDPSMNSARDHNGHGSHTLSIAGGNFVPYVSYNTVWMGTAKGGSPQARVAAYKVCWPPSFLGVECDSADVVKGFETAVNDGVDVISASLGSHPTEYMNDALAIASFHAVKKGVTVVFSGGNKGPSSGTVTNVAPWVITVGASTIDREFQSFLFLANGLNLKGLSMPKPLPHPGFYTLINAANAKAETATEMDAMHCLQGTLDPEKVQGKILVCLRGVNDNVAKGTEAVLAGAAGMVLCNDKAHGFDITADFHVLPAIHITFPDGHRLYDYLNSTNLAKGYIFHPVPAIHTVSAPVVANFSSRGPNSITPEILKPDIVAPGVNILAAYSEDPEPVLPYNILSGTSVACPHVAGVVGLLKSVHPDWSPSAIKSAIMTTASTKENQYGYPMSDEIGGWAEPFSRGAGEINPNRAMNPGLVYNLTVNDYLDFLCTRGYDKSIIQKFSDQPYECPEKYNILDFNYPSITVHQLNGTVTVTRRLTNVGPPGSYTVDVWSPMGIIVDVEPKTLAFGKKGEEHKFELTMKAQDGFGITDYVYGKLTWSNSNHYVKSPIVVSVLL
ncbi:putative tripeptidyl-peptidase II [Helianthus annuus]|nr:putative tripeptidyl-peptidase II [Helianthus annuus]